LRTCDDQNKHASFAAEASVETPKRSLDAEGASARLPSLRG